MSRSSRNYVLASLIREGHLLGAQMVLSHQRGAETLGLNPTDLLCLEMIGAGADVTAGRLAEALQLTTGAITGVLDRLERAGFVRRERDPEDRRRVLVRLSPERQRELGQLLDPLAAALDEVAQSLSENELGAALDFVSRLHPKLAEESARLRPATGREGRESPELVPRSVPLPAGGRDVRLQVSSGLVDTTLDADPGLPDLARAAFADNPPTLEVAGETLTVHVRHKRRLLFKGWTHAGRLTLNGDFRWTILLDGGLYRVQVRLTELDLAGLEVRGGLSQVDVSLPAPAGTVPVQLSGGADHVTLDRPSGTALRIHIGSGASKLRLDSFDFGAVGDTRWQTPDYDTSPNRYDITLRGGAHHLTVTTR
jgi:DNA-binding MarR family transcriptional regulator